MAAQRWSKDAAVRRDDQFTAAPGFVDGHESRHLPMWGRLTAAWHGMSRGRRVVIAASFVALSLSGGLGIWGALDTWGGEVGTQPEAHGPLAGESDSDGLLPDEGQAQEGLGDLGEGVPGLLNGTASSPSPPSASPGAP